jgi:hypothetical protein
MFKHTRVGRLHTFSLGRFRVKLWRVAPRNRFIPGDRVYCPVPRSALAQ